MHPDVIEAARLEWIAELPEARARRVLLAQAKPEAISDGMATAAVEVSLRSGQGLHEAMHAAKEGE